MSRRTHPMKIREALRLREEGHSKTTIANSATVKCARSTLVELFKRCERQKMTSWLSSGK